MKPKQGPSKKVHKSRECRTKKREPNVSLSQGFNRFYPFTFRTKINKLEDDTSCAVENKKKPSRPRIQAFVSIIVYTTNQEKGGLNPSKSRILRTFINENILCYTLAQIPERFSLGITRKVY